MKNKPWKMAASAVVLAALAAGGWWAWAPEGGSSAVAATPPPSASPSAPGGASALADADAQARAMAPLREVLANYRKIIVLLADEGKLSAAEKAAANQAGMALFHANLAKAQELQALFDGGPLAAPRQRLAVLSALLDYVESDPELFDEDRLAFREIMRQWQVQRRQSD